MKTGYEHSIGIQEGHRLGNKHDTSEIDQNELADIVAAKLNFES